jgi:hypothetical protein
MAQYPEALENCSEAIENRPKGIPRRPEAVQDRPEALKDRPQLTEGAPGRLDAGLPPFVSYDEEDTMTRSEYEERRRALEEQVSAEMALIQAAHETRIRSLERLWQAEAEGDATNIDPFQAPARLAGSKTASQPIPVPPAAKRKPARPRGQVVDDLWNILPQLPEVFERPDVIKALGYEPTRSSLTRALMKLRDEGHIAIEDHSEGGFLTSYRRVGAE